MAGDEAREPTRARAGCRFPHLVFIAIGIVFLVEGALRPGYDPMRAPVSALAIGPRGWVQRVNFIVTGVLMLACAFGLSSALRPYGGSFWAPLFVALYALGLVDAGIFVTGVT